MMRDIFDVPCETFVLQSKSPIPAWDLKLQLIQGIKAKPKNQKPSLLVFSYAGHGLSKFYTCVSCLWRARMYGRLSMPPAHNSVIGHYLQQSTL
ncbi:hypothetical protein VN97_g6880 [Penicillium thymicola]|uniref:Uncharacterized protein n=1 Tax=Penicillium thymicola TaxID=293382 RepID=A0AAI9X7V5_PENTH|nr:hypothetical protein VN97_g6880 [Penicillium thymicola]